MSHDPRFLASAIDIVLRAGDIQMRYFGRDFRVEKKGAIDLVTEVDLEVERMCRSVLATRFPSHRVLAEELGGTQATVPMEGCCWIFDPIDGTTNFAHGLPVFCSALALEVDGSVEIAAVYDPTRRELFTAERGRGSWLNGRRMAVSTASALLDAVLVTGFPYDVHDQGDDIVSLFGAFVKRARAVRRFGSAAIDLCYVAAGRLDGFWEERLKPWDIAAATLLVEEAGGQLTGMDGSPFSVHGGHVLATNGPLHQHMLATIAGHRRGRTGSRSD